MKSTHIFCAFALLWAVMVYVFSGDIANLVYGSKLPSCGIYLGIIALCAPFGLTGYVPAAVLPALGREKLKMSVIAASCIVAVPTFYYSALYWGLAGISWAITIIYIGQCIALFMAQGIALGFMPDLAELWRIFVPALLMTAFFSTFKGHLPDVLLALVGVTTYLVALLIFREDEVMEFSARANAIIWFKRVFG